MSDHYDRINLTVPKGRKAELQAAAQRYNTSVNSYIGTLISEALKHEEANPGGYFHIFSKGKSTAD